MKRYFFLIPYLLIHAITDLTAQFFPITGPIIVPGNSFYHNYIKTTIYLDEGGSNLIKTVRYYDGLGRLVQTVQQNTGAENNTQDRIYVREYDAFGRESKIWLPVYRTWNGISGMASSGMYYADDIATNTKSQYGNDAYAYSEPIYEASPLNRVVRQYGPGQAWRTADRFVKTDYLTNAASDCIYYYISGDVLAKNGYYATGTLYATKTTDEDGKASYEFKDKLGRTILERQTDGTENFDVYYVYDDFGNLRWTLPPMFESAASLSEGCENYGYYYKYDERNRCVEKKLPQAGSIYYVYDKADRLIFSQDGEQRSTNDWTFYKYDVFGRSILTGVWKNSGKTQADLNNSYKNTLVTETYSALGVYNYTWNSLPGVPSNTVLQVNYYDNYLFRTASARFNSLNFVYVTPQGFDDKRYGTDANDGKSKGLLTGTVSVMLDDPDMQIYSVFYYDNKGRVIQSVASNHLGGYEKEYVNYSFTGNPVRKQTIHTSSYLGGTAIMEIYTYSYDHVDRLTTTKYSLNYNMEFALSTLLYDNQGRIAGKNQSENVMTANYSYNIRNWLINTNVKYNMYNAVAFDEKIYYNESYIDNTPQYNGNISAVCWKHLSYGNFDKGYYYTYDGLNRLKKGQFFCNTITISNNAFTEEIGQYDKNGNIKKMKRYAKNKHPDDNGMLVDDLTLNYRGNQLADIADAVPASVSTIGFALPGNPPATPVVYNNNGAVKQNFYNGIAKITYNVLYLPEKIRFMYGHSIQYGYDAAGEKRKVIHRTVKSNLNIPLGTTDYTPNEADVQSTLTTDYCAGGHIVYENGTLKRILNPEGYAALQPNFTYRYFYYDKDHLGSNRGVFTATTTTLLNLDQEINFYPFGLPYVPSNPGDGTSYELQPYKFAGKEYDEMHGLNWYDFGARFYNGIVPMFMTPDPMAEKYPWISPYAYCANNPVRFVDPDGRDVKIYYEDENRKRQQMLYTANMKYEGNNAFVSASVNYLNSMYNNGGSDILDVLIGSKNSFNMMNQTPIDDKGNTLDALQFSEAVGGGGDIYAGLLTNSKYSNYRKVESVSHELFHGFQYEKGQGGTSIFNEVEANVYSSVIATNWANSTDYMGALSSNGLGNGTAAGDLYQTSFSSLINNGFSKDVFHNALKSFRAGSNSNASGGYNTYPLHRNQKYYLLNKYLPKLK